MASPYPYIPSSEYRPRRLSLPAEEGQADRTCSPSPPPMRRRRHAFALSGGRTAHGVRLSHLDLIQQASVASILLRPRALMRIERGIEVGEDGSERFKRKRTGARSVEKCNEPVSKPSRADGETIGDRPSLPTSSRTSARSLSLNSLDTMAEPDKAEQTAPVQRPVLPPSFSNSVRPLPHLISSSPRSRPHPLAHAVLVRPVQAGTRVALHGTRGGMRAEQRAR